MRAWIKGDFLAAKFARDGDATGRTGCLYEIRKGMAKRRGMRSE